MPCAQSWLHESSPPYNRTRLLGAFFPTTAFWSSCTPYKNASSSLAVLGVDRTRHVQHNTSGCPGTTPPMPLTKHHPCHLRVFFFPFGLCNASTLSHRSSTPGLCRSQASRCTGWRRPVRSTSTLRRGRSRGWCLCLWTHRPQGPSARASR